MTIMQLYLLTRLFEMKDTFLALIGPMAVLSVICMVIALVSSTESPNVSKTSKKYAKIFVSLLILSIVGNVMAPSQKDAYVILGGYYATNNEEIKKLPENVVAASNAFLKEYTAKATKEIEKEEKQK